MDFLTSTGFNPKMELIFDFAGNPFGLSLFYFDYGISEHIFKIQFEFK
ncbi:MAG: hypothetical protein IPP34_09610 [Bacteroidetes bacterium]|nr:hypothetical protein [Bacteroidota bacterium]